MEARRITERVSLLGAVDWDRRLFDALIPLPDGTSYNAYLVEGSQATALLDTVDPTMTPVLLRQLERVPKLDYVIAHHAEQDHSGSIPAVLAKYPDAKVVCSQKCKGMLGDLLRVPAERILAVEDGQALSLGDKTLQFVYTPWVHWPETMSTYLVEDKVLFSCDFFGSHLATSDLYADEGRVYMPAKRYYAEIMMPFRNIIQRNLEKLKGYEIGVIAPSHGPVYRRPAFIIDAYRDWVADEPKNLALVAYVSMHDSTRLMAEHLVSALVARGVTTEQVNLVNLDAGKLAMALVDAATIVIASPTVLTGLHPAAAYAAFLANALRPRAKHAAYVGSYGWGGKPAEQLASLLPLLKLEMLPPVICRGLPAEADYAALDSLAEAIASRHQGLVAAGVA